MDPNHLHLDQIVLPSLRANIHLLKDERPEPQLGLHSFLTAMLECGLVAAGFLWIAKQVQASRKRPLDQRA
jgi:hypothetical protein